MQEKVIRLITLSDFDGPASPLLLLFFFFFVVVAVAVVFFLFWFLFLFFFFNLNFSNFRILLNFKLLTSCSNNLYGKITKDLWFVFY